MALTGLAIVLLSETRGDRPVLSASVWFLLGELNTENRCEAGRIPGPLTPEMLVFAPRHGPVGLVHVGAHTNTTDKALEQKVYHRTPFRRSVDEGLLDGKRVVQIGIRGSSRTLDPYRYSRSQVMDAAPSPPPTPCSTRQSIFCLVKEGVNRCFTEVQKARLGVDVAAQNATLFTVSY